MHKAVVCNAYGEIAALSYEDVDTPSPGDGELLIETEASGVNFPDGLLVRGLYQMRPEPPFIPGMEVVGRVRAAGSDAGRFAVGDRVLALVKLGGYSEMVVAPQASVMKLPDAVPAGDACALLCAYGTAHHALKQRARLKHGETLVVIGAAGSTGLAAVQIGKAMGARVIAVASSNDKRRLAIESGADASLGYDGLKDALKEATGGNGADVVFDPVGGDAFDAATRSMARGGRLLVVGFASGTIPKFPVNLALVKEYALVGVFWGNFTSREPDVFADNMRELFAWHADGAVRPHLDVERPLAEAPHVLERILDRGAMGKSILTP